MADQPADVVLAGRPGSRHREAAIESIREAGAASVRWLDFDAADPAGHPAVIQAAFDQPVDVAIVAFGVLDDPTTWLDHAATRCGSPRPTTSCSSVWAPCSLSRCVRRATATSIASQLGGGERTPALELRLRLVEGGHGRLLSAAWGGPQGLRGERAGGSSRGSEWTHDRRPQAGADVGHSAAGGAGHRGGDATGQGDDPCARRFRAADGGLPQSSRGPGQPLVPTTPLRRDDPVSRRIRMRPTRKAADSASEPASAQTAVVTSMMAPNMSPLSPPKAPTSRCTQTNETSTAIASEQPSPMAPTHPAAHQPKPQRLRRSAASGWRSGWAASPRGTAPRSHLCGQRAHRGGRRSGSRPARRPERESPARAGCGASGSFLPHKAPTCTNKTRTIAATPMAPVSGVRIISSARAASRPSLRLPKAASPSKQSARPSRCIAPANACQIDEYDDGCQ